jgi:hypothetical protein
LAFWNQTLLGLPFLNDFASFICIYIYILLVSCDVFVFVGAYLIACVQISMYICSRSYMYWLDVGFCLPLRSLL